jgi:acyl-CoA thioester hydrolase
MDNSSLSYRGTVYPWHCDHMGHMNVMWYVGKFDEATWHLLAQLGFTPSRLRDEQRGMVAVSQTIEYKTELLAGDILSIRSSIQHIGTTSIRFRHEMFNEETGALAAVTNLVGVHIDRSTRKPQPLPDDFRARAARLTEKECHASA